MNTFTLCPIIYTLEFKSVGLVVCVFLFPPKNNYVFLMSQFLPFTAILNTSHNNNNKKKNVLTIVIYEIQN